MYDQIHKCSRKREAREKLRAYVRAAMQSDEWEELEFLYGEEGVNDTDESVQEVEISDDSAEPAAKDPDAKDPDAGNDDGEGTFFDVSPQAMEAFERIIKPQIQAKLDAASFEDLAAMIDEIEGLGSSQNPDLEESLIYHKPINLETQTFYRQIQSVFRDWIRPLLKQEEGGGEGDDEPSGGNANKEYVFNFT